MTQLLLELSTPRRYSFDTMVLHPGIAESVAAIRSAYSGARLPLPALFLHGPAGTGKTHILKALVSLLDQVFHEQGLASVFIQPRADEFHCPELERVATQEPGALQGACAVILDGAHLVQAANRAHLWSLFNQVTRSGAALIMASRTPPGRTFSDDPHLQSRIVSGLVLGLEPPEDTVRMLILDKMARDRNVRISPDVTKYLVTRKSRNITDLDHILDTLDRASMVLKRRITVPLIKMLEAEGQL